jgi:hypothetical protein
LGWWIAVPVGVALGLLLALGLDRAASPATAQGGSGFTLSIEQLRINQRIAQQGVKRANRANSRISGVQAAATGPAGPPGPAGPAGPGASRMAYSAAVGAPPQKVLDIPGLAITIGCEAGAGGAASVTTTAALEQPTTLAGSASTDTGTDPNNPGPPDVNNFGTDLPAGPAVPLGGPGAADGEYARSIANVLFITPARTVSVDAVSFVDAAADRCVFNGVAVAA